MAEHERASTSKLNWLRASVLGANDGIVSISSLILGVAGAAGSRHALFIAGVAGLGAGAFSMAVGEYVSVSSQRDSERAFIKREAQLLRDDPEHELEGLAKTFQDKGATRATALKMAQELTRTDALKAHLDAEHHLDPEDLNSPGQAALASMCAFTAGGLVPLLATILSPEKWRIAATFTAVVLALTLTGYFSASYGGAKRRPAMLRVVLGGVAAMALTYLIGKAFGTVLA